MKYHWTCVLNLCLEPVHWTSVLNLYIEAVYWTCVLNLCIEPVHRTSVLNQCIEPVHWTCVLNQCLELMYWIFDFLVARHSFNMLSHARIISYFVSKTGINTWRHLIGWYRFHGPLGRYFTHDTASIGADSNPERIILIEVKTTNNKWKNCSGKVVDLRATRCKDT